MDLITSDLHLVERTWRELPGVRGDAFFALEALSDIARGHDVDHIALAGDIFDSPRPSALEVHTFCNWIDQLLDAGTDVVFVEGQHDRSSRRGPETVHAAWAALAGCSHVHDKAFIIGKKLAWGLDFQRTDELPAALERIPADTEILVCHQRWAELGGGSSDPSLGQVPVGTVFTGDLHIHCKKTLVGQYGRFVTAYSPGATHACSVSEPPSRAVYLLDDHGVITSHPLPSRPIRRYTVATDRDVEHLLSVIDEVVAPGHDLPEDIATPVVEVRHGTIPTAARAVIIAKLQSRCHLLMRNLTEEASVVFTTTTAEVPGVDSVLEQLIRTTASDAETAELAVDLLRRPDALTDLEASVERLCR
jgi:hypothetical protein